MNADRTVTLAALVLAATLLGSAAPAAPPDFASLRLVAYTPPKAAPSFALPDLAGRTVSLADLKGHLVLVFFWATW
jgi:cytochrome oxidase Cu insertion factor (SCO1/SenC/PrrC family)